jgi:hypothetical protein
MVVAMSRDICVHLYNEIIKLRPEWHDADPEKGMVKIITANNGRILGCSIVGPNAGDLIALWTLAVTQKLKVSAIASMVLPYPTLGEAGKRAAITYYAGVAAKPLIRKAIGFLKFFG